VLGSDLAWGWGISLPRAWSNLGLTNACGEMWMLGPMIGDDEGDKV
jgi:hypothetical protein